jgi:hypothetical protein
VVIAKTAPADDAVVCIDDERSESLVACAGSPRARLPFSVGHTQRVVWPGPIRGVGNYEIRDRVA